MLKTPPPCSECGSSRTRWYPPLWVRVTDVMMSLLPRHHAPKGRLVICKDCGHISLIKE